jgi:hypothetical protein
MQDFRSATRFGYGLYGDIGFFLLAGLGWSMKMSVFVHDHLAKLRELLRRCGLAIGQFGVDLERSGPPPKAFPGHG